MMRRALSVLVALAIPVAAIAVGCKSNQIGVTNNNGPGESEGGTRAHCQATPPTSKPNTTPMALMGLTDGQTCYWIDETEVTVVQYRAFLSDTASKTQEPSCATNKSFAPDPACTGDSPDAGGSDAGAADDGGTSSGGLLPMACVDWCDAWAYCAWAGKTLCKGGAAAADPATSRWYSACSEGGHKSYPNSDGTRRQTCNARGGGELVPVGTSTCATSDSVQDLSGNVAEWVDECDGNGQCNVRGGSVQSNTQEGSCKGVLALPKLPPAPSVLAYVGFRCCVDAPPGSVVAQDR